MNRKINQILRELAARTPGIEGVVLVSSQGKPLTSSIGIGYERALITAIVMLSLGEHIRQEFRWERVQKISVQAEEGYITLIPCYQQIFLLMRTIKAPLGFFEDDLKRAIAKLKAEFEKINSVELALFLDNPQTRNADITKTQVDSAFIHDCQQELVEFIGPIAPIVCQHVLAQNPELSVSDFVEAIANQIPDRQQAIEFQQRLLSDN
ncbi:hypothetical protein NIES593_16775 [Hydrococcus rivularis NIES-593]|uniref:Roadblock/LAMTOR2 domain-containing protein n=1 Tax=Hydrococcus rivularis NIES-593 TaxID=1921803 RepID=A0A1U7HBV2_9CYAN|nr:roadblock/LC7 domain-containing protein [Hydrococcus rivularis]OKH21082.1 hypothetical protein NIES593_16775 [Hydrococcus rivularis NIES-593]